MNETVLVVAAHPDDEVLGAGATMARHVENGDSVHVLILGEGILSRGEGNVGTVAQLQQDGRNALKRLGVTDVEFLSFPDNRFDSVPLLKVVKAIEKKLAEVKPSVMYTHHSSDLNIDHQITFTAVLTAARPVVHISVKRILAFEIPSSTEWSATGFSFQPNCFVDVSETLQKKLDALKEYKTEMRDFPHPRSIVYVEALAKIRGGGAANLRAAEAFMLIRESR